MGETGRQPTYCLQQVAVFTHWCGEGIFVRNFIFYNKCIHTHEGNMRAT